MTSTVAMDTNALMMPVELDVRVCDELERLLDAFECVVAAATVEELEKLADGSGAAATAASVGRDLADRCRTIETEASYADDAIVELAERGEADYVVTNDEPLRERLHRRGVRVICIRGRDTLQVTEP